MNLNKKGQVLIAFIIILPLILVLLVNVIDIGLYGVEKKKINDTVKTSVRYGIKNINDEEIESKVTALILKDIPGVKKSDIFIDTSNNYIKVSVKKKYQPLFKINNSLETNISYYGSINDSKIEIKKE